MENLIFKRIYSYNSNYCHVLELENVQNLKDIIENLIENEFCNDTKKDIIEFFDSIEIYYLVPDNQNEIAEDEEILYDFDINKFVLETIES